MTTSYSHAAFHDILGYLHLSAHHVPPSRIAYIAFGLVLFAGIWALLPAWDALDNEPPYLPYTIPCASKFVLSDAGTYNSHDEPVGLGHTIPFIRNSHRFLHKAT